MKLLKRLSCFIVAMSVALSCASCSTGDTTWAFDYEGTRINSGLYIGLSISAYIQASYQVEDYTKDILTQTVEEQPAKDWIVNKTRELADRYAVVESEFERLGLELSEDDIKLIDAELKSTWESAGTIYEANGVGKNSYRLILENSKKESALFDGYYGEGGTDEVTQDEMFEYFKEEYAVINAMTISKDIEVSFEDEDGEDSEDSEDSEENEEDAEIEEDEKYLKLLDYAQRINKGESFNEIAAEYEAELEAELEAQAAAEEELLAAEEQALQDLIAETGDALNNDEVEEGIDEDEIEETDDETTSSEHESQSESDEDELEDGDDVDEVQDEEDEQDDETSDVSDENTDEIQTDEIEETDSSSELTDEPQIQDDEETKFSFAKSSTSPSTSFVETLFGFEANGKAEVIDDGMSYYLIIRYEIEEGDARFEEKIDSLVSEMKNEEYNEKIDGLVEAMTPISINDASINRYDPKNIDI